MASECEFDAFLPAFSVNTKECWHKSGGRSQQQGQKNKEGLHHGRTLLCGGSGKIFDSIESCVRQLGLSWILKRAAQTTNTETVWRCERIHRSIAGSALSPTLFSIESTSTMKFTSAALSCFLVGSATAFSTSRPSGRLKFFRTVIASLDVL